MNYWLLGIGAGDASHGADPSSPSPRMPALPRTSSALPRLGSAALVVDGDGRLLLGMRTKPPLEGHWVLPGGGVQPFESVASALEREVLEETGLVVSAGEQLGVWEVIEPPLEHRVIVYSRAKIVGGRLASGSDLEDATFWSREQLGELALTPLVADVLEHLGWLKISSEMSPHSRHAA